MTTYNAVIRHRNGELVADETVEADNHRDAARITRDRHLPVAKYLPITTTKVEPVLRHEPTEECDGTPAVIGRARRICQECGIHLCWCEAGYGHDCEV